MSRLSHYFSFAQTPGQLPVLDGLRGLAVLLVLLRHGSQPFWSQTDKMVPVFGYDLGTFFMNGWIGVDLFFVLSGFLITHHILRLQDRQGSAWSWGNYLGKRALRIVPAYYAVLFLALLGSFPGYAVSDHMLGVRTAYHLLFLQDYLPANIVVAFWSLGVEEKFYLIAPFLVLGAARLSSLQPRLAIIAALILMSIGARVATAVNNPGIEDYQTFFYVFRSPFHMTLDPILMGVAIAFVFRARGGGAGLEYSWTAPVAFWSGVVLLVWLGGSEAMMDSITTWDKTLQPTLIAFSFACVTFGLLFGGGPAVLFRTAVLRFFARISYSLYLVHLPLIPLAMSLASDFSSKEVAFGLFFPIFLLLSVAAALILHFTVEKPFLLLKDRVPGRAPGAPALAAGRA